MQTVAHFYRPSFGDVSLRQGLTLQALIDENEGFENFAHDVWNACIAEGQYNDSDGDTVSIYFAEK